jgi:hypothetical protein
LYAVNDVLSALDRYCADNGETLEAREQRLGAPSAPIRAGLIAAGERTLNRNIRLALSQLEIETEAFLPYLEEEG